MTEHFCKRTRIAAPARRVFDWHRRPETFAELLPPWEQAEFVSRTGGIEEPGSRLEFKLGPKPLQLTWIAEHTHYEPGRAFRDQQIKGPFALWIHEHRVEPDGPDACWLVDDVEYALPGGRLAHWLVGGLVRRRLERTFDYRHAVTARACESPPRAPADRRDA